jgi:thiol-disulfide isomerase/thioredoxin
VKLLTLATFIIFFSFCSISSVGAAEPFASASDPYAVELLKATCDFYKALKSYSCSLEEDLSLKKAGVTNHHHSKFICNMVRPNLIDIVIDREGKRSHLAVLPSESFLYRSDWNMYINLERIGAEAAFANQDFQLITNGAIRTSLLTKLRGANPYSEIVLGFAQLDYQGAEMILGKSCHHLRLVRSEYCTDIWVRAKGSPWIMKVTPYRSQETGTGSTLLTFIYRRQQDSPRRISLACRPPANAIETGSFEGNPDREKRHPLLHSKAPQFKLDTFDGTTFALKAKRGKVVIIEFWATWCAPCCRALPVLAAIADKYKNEEIEFLAINKNEDDEKVRTFLNAHPFITSAGIDRDEKVCALYDVGAIPQTVIIDRYGKVSAVHIGNSDDLRDKITSELEQLLHR